jgi:hypothetical protein
MSPDAWVRHHLAQRALFPGRNFLDERMIFRYTVLFFFSHGQSSDSPGHPLDASLIFVQLFSV